MWTIRYPGSPGLPDAVWGWDKENDRPHFFDVTVLRPKNPDKHPGVAIPVMLDRSSKEPLRIELGRVLKDRSGISENWWCFGFYRNHLRQPSIDGLFPDLPLEDQITAWNGWQKLYYERGAGFVTRRAAITHMLYRTGWYDQPY